MDQIHLAMEMNERDVAQRMQTGGMLPAGRVYVLGGSSYGKSKLMRDHLKELAEMTKTIEEQVGPMKLKVSDVPKEKARQLRANILGPRKGRWS
jgi:hypothetical protein